jgi:bis(5'-nucleosyl)-tetraphosphatase (symmetrical)
VARLAIGDVQGCLEALRALLRRADFSSDRDQLWLVGDLVNRGPDSLGVLRFVRALGDNAVVVLGNHDLHLLAVALGAGARTLRAGDTLDPVLQASDRDALLEWLITRPLAVAQGDDLMVHAGLPPQWTPARTLELAAEVEARLRRDPAGFFAQMYGNRPDRWDESLQGTDRLRFVVNALTRMRFCRADGTIDLKQKGRPGTQPDTWLPWFEVPDRLSRSVRVICGHWSALGFVERPGLLALDSGCVWGGSLTAASLDDGERWQQPSAGYRVPAGGD